MIVSEYHVLWILKTESTKNKERQQDKVITLKFKLFDRMHLSTTTTETTKTPTEQIQHVTATKNKNLLMDIK